jgi:hypothetical protein
VHHVFVSYSRRDGAWVDLVVKGLHSAKHPVWIDRKDIAVSAPWIQEITDAITEADLFLICDSPNWKTSLPCSAELQLATAATKRIVRIPVGGELQELLALIKSERERQPVAYRMRTELSTLARDWNRAGRPKSALVSRRRLRLLRLAKDDSPGPGPVEEAFLAASTARARRRSMITAALAIVVTASVGGFLILRAAQNEVIKNNDAQAAAYMQIQELKQGEANDPIRALSAATRLGGTESAQNASYISHAFDEPIADDAFRVPAAARRFASHTIASTVAVVARDDRIWARAAAARSVRLASAVRSGVLRHEPGAPALRIRVPSDAGEIQVLRHGVLFRRIYVDRHPDAIAVSPDGRELAVGAGNSVDVVDIALGRTRSVLRGSGVAVRDVAWSRDGNRVWALGRGLVMSWRVRDGTVLIDAPQAQFEALLPAGRFGRAWVVTRTGHLEEFDIDTGHRLRLLSVPDTIFSAAADPSGEIAALSGASGVWIVRLGAHAAGKPRRLAVPGCSFGRPAFRNASSFALPCLGGPVLTVSVASAQVVHRLRVPAGGAFAVKFLPRSGVLLVTDEYAGLYTVTPHDGLREVFRALCGGSITRIAVATDDSVVIPVGAGTGLPGCERRLEVGANPIDPSNWRADSVLDPEISSVVAEAAAVSAAAHVFAYGYDDGTITLHPTENILPTKTITSVVGEIRDMLTTPNDDLLVATKAGVVQRIHLCEDCLSNHALARVAGSVLNRALEIKVAKRTRPARE